MIFTVDDLVLRRFRLASTRWSPVQEHGIARLRLEVKGDTNESLDITGQLGF